MIEPIDPFERRELDGFKSSVVYSGGSHAFHLTSLAPGRSIRLQIRPEDRSFVTTTPEGFPFAPARSSAFASNVGAISHLEFWRNAIAATGNGHGFKIFDHDLGA
jgi:hypothetical protein